MGITRLDVHQILLLIELFLVCTNTPDSLSREQTNQYNRKFVNKNLCSCVREAVYSKDIGRVFAAAWPASPRH